jgi:hypothetical protein
VNANSSGLSRTRDGAFPSLGHWAKTVRSRKKANGGKGDEVFHVSLTEDSTSPQ